MHTRLIALLQNNMGKPITADLSAFICKIADEYPLLVSRETIAAIEAETYDGFLFSVEKIAEIENEIQPLHAAHWVETEAHRNGDLSLNMDYEEFAMYERAGRYLLFTIRKDGKLVGNCAMYLNNSMHTQTLMATEDTLYLCPEARKRGVAREFIRYCEDGLQQLGVREINVSVKTVNKAARFFRMNGYEEVDVGLHKMLEEG